MVKRILVGTDRSETASRAVAWAADMARRFDAELLVVQVVAPDGGGAGPVDPSAAAEDLRRYAQAVTGLDAGARVVVDADPAHALVDVAERERVDVLVVGNLGMRGRTEFLLANVPNRVSHTARCSVVIVNASELGLADGPSPAPTLDMDGELLARASRIATVMAKLGVRSVFGSADGGGSNRDQARRLRQALEELGPTFAKLGQILSTRPDLLPSGFAEELARLQDHVPPLTEAEVVSMMERELGVPWEDVFESIDPAPLAAGTIAQVHRATLCGGDRVVIKVQRPTAERDIYQDLALLERFARKAAGRPTLGQMVDLPAIVDHLSASLRREVDFTQEAESTERLGRQLAPFTRLGVPRVYRHLSTRRLLVLEEIQGVPISQAPDSEARRQAGRQLLESYYGQILSDGFFHADPHPGNLLWSGDKLFFLDCGMVGNVAPETRALLSLLLLAFWQKDAAFLSELVLMLADEGPADVDLAALSGEMDRLIENYRDLALTELRLGPILQEITEISLRHGIRVPAPLALTAKALAQMQLAATELDPTLDPLAVAGSFFLRSLAAQLRQGGDPKRLLYEAQKLRVRAVRLVEALERLAGARPGPNLQVQFRGTERLEETVRRAGRHVALALTASGSLVGAALTVNSPRVGRWVPVVLGSAGGALTTGLVADLVRARR